MFKFFDFLVNIINVIWGFISGCLDFLEKLFSFLVYGISFMSSIIMTLPPFAIGFFALVVAISIVSLFLGHFIDW